MRRRRLPRNPAVVGPELALAQLSDTANILKVFSMSRALTSDRTTDSPHAPDLIRTGIMGLDQLVRGGLTPNRMYLVEGLPGTGKTTLALQFLLEGRGRG